MPSSGAVNESLKKETREVGRWWGGGLRKQWQRPLCYEQRALGDSRQPLPLPVAQVQGASCGSAGLNPGRSVSTNPDKPSPGSLRRPDTREPTKQLGGAYFPSGVLGYWGQEARVMNRDWVPLVTSLAVHWLRVQASTAGCTGSMPGQRTKIIHAVRWYGQKKKNHNKRLGPF